MVDNDQLLEQMELNYRSVLVGNLNKLHFDVSPQQR